MLLILNDVFSVFLVAVFVRLIDKTSAPKRICKSKIYKTLGVFCLISMCVLIEINPFISDGLAKVLYLLSFIIFSTIFYSNRLVEKLILALTYTTTHMYSGYLVHYICKVFVDESVVTSSAFSFLVNTIMMLIVYLITEFILSNILDYKSYVFTNIEFIALFSFNITGYILSLYQLNIFTTSVSALCVIAVLIMSALIKILRQKEYNEKLLSERNSFLENQDKLVREKEEAKYQSYKKSIEHEQEIRRINHDLMHHFNYILDCDNIDKIKDYISDLKGTVKRSSNYFDTGSSILDLILEEKCRQSEELGIKFKVMGGFSEKLKLEPASISIIFGNLLNNAIEGCNRLKQSDYKSIDVAFYQEPGNGLYIKISNTADIKNIKRENNKIKTSKKTEERFHGIGLDSVRKELEKYKSFLKISMHHNTFVAEVKVS